MSQPPDDSEELIQIRQYASLISQRPDDTNVGAQYRALLDRCADRAVLESLVDRLGPFPDAAIPVLERLLALNPDNADLHLRLGYVHFTAGDDPRAAACLARAQELAGETVPILRLAATLARDNREKKRLYTKILFLDPHNREVFHHLLELRGTFREEG